MLHTTKQLFKGRELWVKARLTLLNTKNWAGQMSKQKTAFVSTGLWDKKGQREEDPPEADATAKGKQREVS